MNNTVSTATEGLAMRLAQPVGDTDRKRAALLVLDWLGCVLGALRSPLARQLTGIVGRRDTGSVTAMGLGRREPEPALLLNASLGNVLEMDDVHRGAILHPGPVVIPVALAACETAGAGGRAFLDAVVRGYEAAIRVGHALGTVHYRYWHPTSTAGAFGAAAASASVLGLDVDATADALGTAGSRTGGLWQMRHEPVPTKSIHNAQAAHSGWLAGTLAAAGVRGPRRILEGEQGLFAATAPGADAQEIMRDDDAWLIHGTSLKPWPACRHVHPTIDAMLEAMRDAGDTDPDAIERIDVATYDAARRFCDRRHPVTELEAKFSLQHAVAAIVCLGRPHLSHYTPEACVRDAVRSLRERVVVHVEEACDARFPAHYGASVVVSLADGRRREAACEDAWGDPERPLTQADVRAKAQSLAAWGGVPEDLAKHLFDAALALAEGGSLDTVCRRMMDVPPCA